MKVGKRNLFHHASTFSSFASLSLHGRTSSLALLYVQMEEQVSSVVCFLLPLPPFSIFPSSSSSSSPILSSSPSHADRRKFLSSQSSLPLPSPFPLPLYHFLYLLLRLLSSLFHECIVARLTVQFSVVIETHDLRSKKI